jgi:hypothetical protein
METALLFIHKDCFQSLKLHMEKLHAQRGGARILIKVHSTKVVDCRVLEKASMKEQ